jgi:hypothetical protein
MLLRRFEDELPRHPGQDNYGELACFRLGDQRRRRKQRRDGAGGVAGDQGCRKTRAKYCWGNSVYINFLLWFTSVIPSTPIAVRVYFQAVCWKRRFHIKETAVSPDEVMSALRRYLENTGDTERAAALKMGVNQHTLCRWLSDEQSPKKGKMALAAFFLRQAGYL